MNSKYLRLESSIFSFTAVEGNKTIKQRPYNRTNFIRKSIKIQYHH